MPRNHERVAIVNKLRENARKCKVDLVREDAGREQVTAMLSRIRRSSGPAAQGRSRVVGPALCLTAERRMALAPSRDRP